MGDHITETDQKNNNPEFLQKSSSQLSWVTQYGNGNKVSNTWVNIPVMSAVNGPWTWRKKWLTCKTWCVCRPCSTLFLLMRSMSAGRSELSDTWRSWGKHTCTQREGARGREREWAAGHEWERWEYCYYSCTTMRTVLSLETFCPTYKPMWPNHYTG